jgi:hypothetical protein
MENPVFQKSMSGMRYRAPITKELMTTKNIKNTKAIIHLKLNMQ